MKNYFLKKIKFDMRVNKIFDQIGFERQTVGFERKIE